MEDIALKNLILGIVQNMTYIPGKRQMRDLILKQEQITVSLERIARLMKELNLEASSSRRRDAYKGLMMNIHPCCALKNYVNRDFYIGCRSVILTDITYIPYGLEQKKYVYLCTFLDAFTKEILGWSADTSMTEHLVEEAWQSMMRDYAEEFPKDTKFYVHSDQGCQYLSQDIRELFKEVAVQSMSRRGNSQDNAPQESFFGRMKARIGTSFQQARTPEQIHEIVKTYINEYNHKMPQSVLGGLTPELFYQYRMTGIYPKEEYFGIPASEMNSLSDIIEQMRDRAVRAAARRSARRKNNTNTVKEAPTHPLDIVAKDIQRLEKQLQKVNKIIDQATNQKAVIEQILTEAHRAEDYLKNCSETTLEELSGCTNWNDTAALGYVKHYHLAFA